MQKGVRILFSPSVQSPEVDTEPKPSNFLPDKDHSIAPWGLQRADGSTIQHFLKVLLDFIQKGRGDPLELLLEGFIIQQFNYVLGCISTAYFVLIK